MSAGLWARDGSGVNRQIKKLYTNVGGVNREIKELWTVKDGVNRKILQNSLPLMYVGRTDNPHHDFDLGGYQEVQSDGSLDLYFWFANRYGSSNMTQTSSYIDFSLSFSSPQTFIGSSYQSTLPSDPSNIIQFSGISESGDYFNDRIGEYSGYIIIEILTDSGQILAKSYFNPSSSSHTGNPVYSYNLQSGWSLYPSDSPFNSLTVRFYCLSKKLQYNEGMEHHIILAPGLVYQPIAENIPIAFT